MSAERRERRSLRFLLHYLAEDYIRYGHYRLCEDVVGVYEVASAEEVVTYLLYAAEAFGCRFLVGDNEVAVLHYLAGLGAYALGYAVCADVRVELCFLELSRYFIEL